MLNNRSVFITPDMVKSASAVAKQAPGAMKRFWDWVTSNAKRFNSGQATTKKMLGTGGLAAGIGAIPSYLFGRSGGYSSGFDTGSAAGLNQGLKIGGGLMGNALNAQNSSFLDRLGNIFTGSATKVPQITVSPDSLQKILKEIRKESY